MTHKLIDSNTVLEVIQTSAPGKNTKFLSASHSLWTRFKNYDKSPPLALEKNGKIVSLIYATFNRDGYTNLYDIVTVQGHEGKGYASDIWDYYVEYACNTMKSKRLKISCTPSSITWHLRNGLIFWAVDPTGSLRSNQPLFKNREEQLMFRKMAIDDPTVALPSEKYCVKLREESLESHNFGKKKSAIVTEAIHTVGNAWLRDALFGRTIFDVA